MSWFTYLSTHYLTGKKGGALASSIFSYMQHGDPFVKSLIKHILKMVSQPNYAMLMRWIYDGELEDTHDEVWLFPSVGEKKVQSTLAHMFE